MDGRQLIKASIERPVEQYEEAGRALAEKLIAEGADTILKNIRN